MAKVVGKLKILKIKGLSRRDKKLEVDFWPEKKRLPDNWHEHHEEGELSVDVYETEKEMVIISTISGVSPKDLFVSIHHDLLTIRGLRNNPRPVGHILSTHRECFWGRFSRTIILPVEVKSELAKAEYKNGVLKIVIPKRSAGGVVPISLIED